MTRVSDYLKYYETGGVTAVAVDIEAGKIGYIAGGRVIGQGIDPSGSLTAFYRTQDATITSEHIAAWKTAYGKLGLVMGSYYPGAIPAVGGLFFIDSEDNNIYAPTGDTFNI